MKEHKIISVAAYQHCPYNYRLMEVMPKKKQKTNSELVIAKDDFVSVTPFYKSISRYLK
jgi:hypothetical protein